MTRLSLDIFVPSSVQSHAERTRGFLGFPYAWYSIWLQDQCEKWGQANSLLHAHKARSRLPGTRIVFPRQELEKVLLWDDHFNGFTSCTYSNFWPLKAISEHLTFSWESMPPDLPSCCMHSNLMATALLYSLPGSPLTPAKNKRAKVESGNKATYSPPSSLLKW